MWEALDKRHSHLKLNGMWIVLLMILCFRFSLLEEEHICGSKMKYWHSNRLEAETLQWKWPMAHFNGLWETQQCLVLTDCFWLNESCNQSSSELELLMNPPEPNPVPFTFSCRYLHQTSNETQITSSIEDPRLTPLLINIWILKIWSIMPLWDVKLGTCFC